MLNPGLFLNVCLFLSFPKAFEFLRIHIISHLRSSSSLTMINLPFFSQDNSKMEKLRSQKRVVIERLISKCQPNGLTATINQRKEVDQAVRELEKLNPTVRVSVNTIQNKHIDTVI